MNELQIFNYDANEIRTVEKDGELWFVLKDVCDVLGISNPTMTAQRLDQDEVTKLNLGSLSGETNIINESGLYRVILRSDKPEAVPFRRWVTREVLPSIRKHGAYTTTPTIERMIADPDFAIQLLGELKQEQTRRKMLEGETAALSADLEVARPKAKYFDELVSRNLLTSFRDTAKQLGVPERDFLKFLIEKKYIYRDRKGKLMPYAEKNKGLFEVKECIGNNSRWSGTQTLITPKGRETFRLLCAAERSGL